MTTPVCTRPVLYVNQRDLDAESEANRQAERHPFERIGTCAGEFLADLQGLPADASAQREVALGLSGLRRVRIVRDDGYPAGLPVASGAAVVSGLEDAPSRGTAGHAQVIGAGITGVTFASTLKVQGTTASQGAP